MLEDDAQNGPDHVDSHRSPAFVISPWVKRHAVDGSMYNTTSMLRTMELLLGLRPMTPFRRRRAAHDRGLPEPARPGPVHRGEAAHPAGRAEPRRHCQPPPAPTRMNFDEADENDDDELNDILWRAIRKDAPPPPSAAISAIASSVGDTRTDAANLSVLSMAHAPAVL